jgi:predicted RNA-binding Zn ribbon-like protein
MDELADRYPPLNAGELCLEFANTFEPDTPAGQPRDHLGPSAAGLIEWARYAGVPARPRRSARLLADALGLRRAVYGVFTAVASGQRPPAGALSELRDIYSRTVARASVDPMRRSWSWPAADPAAVLGPIATSAIELLMSERSTRVKQCAGDRCWVLFVDTTRNGSRRWCQMRYCGNVAKSRKQARQRRAARAVTGRG